MLSFSDSLGYKGIAEKKNIIRFRGLCITSIFLYVLTKHQRYNCICLLWFGFLNIFRSRFVSLFLYVFARVKVLLLKL